MYLRWRVLLRLLEYKLAGEQPPRWHKPPCNRWLFLHFIPFQTISLVFLVTAVVGVEKWYQPILLHFLYRDLFTFMIIGELWLAKLCAYVQSWGSAITNVFWFLVCSFTVTLPMSLYNVLKWVSSSLLTVIIWHNALKVLTAVLWFFQSLPQ